MLLAPLYLPAVAYLNRRGWTSAKTTPDRQPESSLEVEIDPFRGQPAKPLNPFRQPRGDGACPPLG